MSSNPYQVLGSTTPPMLGRNRLFEQLLRQLTKASPDHVSVVGPRHYGKSVVLQNLASLFLPGRGDYVTGAYWDLRHDTPNSDATFLTGFAKILAEALENVNNDVADYIVTGTNTRDDVALALNDLAGRKSRILLVMDGFDHVLGSTAISRNTWDTLRSFAQKTSLRIVTGSRQKLRELCKTEESATSDFWEVFNPNPLKVGRFEDHDWAGIVEPFSGRGIRFDGSAQKEFFNWTGGIPVLTTALLHLAFESAEDGSTLSKVDIDRFSAIIFDERRDLIADLWDDCPSEIQAELADIQSRGELPTSDVNDDNRRELELRGLTKVVGSVLRTGSILVGNFAQQQSSGLESLHRLFGDEERFSKNARSLIELRLAKVPVVDNGLWNTVKKAIRELNEPADSLVWGRRIAEKAFALIWSKELPDGKISDSWVSQVGDSFANQVIPNGGRACRLLQLATGCDVVQRTRLTKFVSKQTYVLLNFIQSVGDHGQHLDEHEVNWSYATAFCLAAVELCDSLVRDFNRA